MKCTTPYWFINNKINIGYKNLYQFVAFNCYMIARNAYNMLIINLGECQIVHQVHYLDSNLESDKRQVPISVPRYTIQHSPVRS